MKRKLMLSAALFCLSTITHAGSIFLNADSCSPFRASDVTGCFLNKTEIKLSGIALKEEVQYTNGALASYTRPIYVLYQGKYMGFSISKNPIESGAVEYIEYSLVDESGEQTPLPGCTIKVAASYPKSTEIIIKKENGKLFC